MFVFQAAGRPRPTPGLGPLGAAPASGTQSRGFTVLLWRTGDLGYAVVPDVDQEERLPLGVKIAGSA